MIYYVSDNLVSYMLQDKRKEISPNEIVESIEKSEEISPGFSAIFAKLEGIKGSKINLENIKRNNISHIMNGKTLREIIISENYEDISSKTIENIKENKMYLFNDKIMISEIYSRDRSSIYLEIIKENNIIKGKTSPDNWISESILNNLIDLECKNLSGLLKVLGIKQNKEIFVQFIIIMEGD